MKKRFLIFPFLVLFVLLSFNSAYAQEDDMDSDSVEIQIMEAEEEELPVYTRDEVAQRNVEGNCWMSFEGFVYDFSEYVPDHDKFMDIREWCGKDMTEDFKDKAGAGRDHREGTYGLLETYKIGRLRGDYDMVDAQVIVDELLEQEEVRPRTTSSYNILIPFVLTTLLYWCGYFLAKRKILGFRIKSFNAFWNTVLLLALLVPAMGFGIFMIVRTQRPELWDINFDFMYWHVELSLVMGFVGIYHLIQRIPQYFVQIKKEKKV